MGMDWRWEVGENRGMRYIRNGEHKVASMAALVTGGTKGIGYAIVEELAKLGAAVYTCSRNEAELGKCLQEWEARNFKVTGSICDVSSAVEREKLMEKVKSEFNGKLNILVSNAGTGSTKPVMAVTLEEYKFVMGMVGIDNFCVYAMTKGAMNQLTKNLAWDRSIYTLQFNSLFAPSTDRSWGCTDTIRCRTLPVYPSISNNDRTKRLNAINQFSDSLGTVQSLRGAVVRPFGSFVSNLYTKWGDLDVSVQLDNGLGNSASKNLKKSLLRDIMRTLLRNGVARTIQFIPNARVPLLIFEGNYHNISFDVSINNYLGVMKSKILLWISQMDERFRDIVLLTKEWAKAQNINDPKSGTLNSYSLCLMVIFHFQTCEPPILPPLGEIYGGNISDDVTGWSSTNSERHVEDVCAANIERFGSRNFRRRNQSSLGQLLVSFFDKFSEVETLASEYAICTHTGRWERIDSNLGWARTSRSMIIEDPFERPENAARTVGPSELRTISNAFTDAYNKLSSSASQYYRDRSYRSCPRPV
ncbi:hypothetical protein OPV22_017267 [Ensete ventricosum]|uniref:Poly(A) RNA polymerase mitochondrial-like central palm domain-containing protein n=1 Tax=Ensete ventricosum TaxID=4639 RepID=A0AAV8R0J9_ENSVE|nr:hypothetical protein OPV22_017267 [Ensete ventricosum]